MLPLEIVVVPSSEAAIVATPSMSVALYVTVGLVPRSYEPALVGALIELVITGPVLSSRTVWLVVVLFPAVSVARTQTV